MKSRTSCDIGLHYEMQDDLFRGRGIALLNVFLYTPLLKKIHFTDKEANITISL